MSDTSPRAAAFTSYALALLRVMTGLLFIEHGTTKIFDFPTHLAMFDGFTFFSILGLSAVIELVGGILLVLGLFTRTTGFILAGEMAAAYFMAHAPRGFFPILNDGELAIVYTFAFLLIAAAGAGAFSIDGVLSGNKNRA
jgi:putative oxidoreductase